MNNTNPVGVLGLGGWVVSDLPHGLDGRFVEVGGLTINHLYHHDAQ